MIGSLLDATIMPMSPCILDQAPRRAVGAALVALVVASCARPAGLPAPAKEPLPADHGPEPPAPGEPQRVLRSPTEPSQWRAVWLNHDAMKEGPDALERLLDQFAAAGINVLFPNTWYRGTVSYPGSAYAAQDSRFAGWDPLAFVVSEGRRRGMKVLPWLEYGFVTHYNSSGDPGDAGAVLGGHRDWAALDRGGKMALRHDDHGVFFYSLSPAVPDGRAFMLGLVLEVARRGGDGLQLDRIRFPALDTSYDRWSRDTYRSWGGRDPLDLGEDEPPWVSWRSGQVGSFVAGLRRAAASAVPGMSFTSAVLPSSANRVHYQDWPSWCAAGDLDVATPLAFNASQDYVDREIAFARAAVAGSRTRLVVGLAAMHAGEANLGRQVGAAVQAGAGVALWDDRWVRGHLDAVRKALAQ